MERDKVKIELRSQKEANCLYQALGIAIGVIEGSVLSPKKDKYLSSLRSVHSILEKNIK